MISIAQTRVCLATKQSKKSLVNHIEGSNYGALLMGPGGFGGDFMKSARRRGRYALPASDSLRRVGACYLRVQTRAMVPLKSNLSPVKWGLLHRHMSSSFLNHGNGWDFGATNFNLLALSGVAWRAAFNRMGRFSALPVKLPLITCKPTVNFYRLPQQLFQTLTLALASDCRRAHPRRQTGKLESTR
jgi:hypothetical protein